MWNAPCGYRRLVFWKIFYVHNTPRKSKMNEIVSSSIFSIKFIILFICIYIYIICMYLVCMLRDSSRIQFSSEFRRGFLGGFSKLYTLDFARNYREKKQHNKGLVFV